MGIKLNKIRIKNFRSLKSVETSLGDVTLLIGANNAGKTSFLRALTIALTSDRKFISKDDLFINSQGDYPSDPTIIVDIEIRPIEGTDFEDEWAQVFGEDVQFDASSHEFFAYRTLIDFTASQSESMIKRYIITTWDSDTADENQEVRANISKIPLFFIDAQRDLQEDLKLAQSYFGKLASQIEYNATQKQSLEASLSQLNEDSVAQSAVLSHLKDSLGELNKTVLANGSGVEITPFPKKLRDLHKGLTVNFQDGGSETFSLEYHGMGTRSWASLLGYKAFVSWIQKKANDEGEMLHPVLALEEPEAHLHPNAQRHVYQQLKQITGQKIISTHSPYIAPLAKIEELRFFYKDGDSTKISDLTSLIPDFKPKEISKLETEIIRTRGELLFARLVVLFEGQTEENALPVFAKKYWGHEAFEKGISLIYCSGGHYKIYLRLLEELKIPWIVFSDYDNATVQSAVVNAGVAIGVTDITSDDRFILLNNSIESYIIDEGYRNQIQDAYFSLKEPEYSDPVKLQAERTRVEALSEEQLKQDKAIKGWKAKMGSVWAQSIVEHADAAKQIPEKMEELFVSIDVILT